MQKPNILWIMSDQHHASAWGRGGREEVQTPHLDRLASLGTTYTRAYCNNPICGPSRACFLTGQYIASHQVTGNNIFNSQVIAARNLGKTFREAGYQSGLIGKGHLPKRWMEDGFEVRRFCDLADAERDDPRSVPYFDYLVRQGLADAYDLGKLTQDRAGSRMERFVSEIPLEHSVEVWTGNETVRFLKERDQSRPFFLQMSFQRPHDPYAPSLGRERLYEPDKLPLPDNADDYLERRMAGKPLFQRDYSGLPAGEGYPYRPESKADLRKQMAYYYSLITTIDEQIGRVLAQLEASGELDNTIIVYHADHGDFAGEHGFMLKNLGIYEAIHRIPFILSYPGGPKGKIEEGMVESVDLFPTLCHLTGVSIPGGGDGHIVTGEQACFREYVVCEWDFPIEPQSRVYAVRDKNYRLVYYPERPDDGELYHCLEDPGEVNNLYRDPGMSLIRCCLLEKAFNQVSNYTRRHGLKEDRLENQLTDGMLARRIHKYGMRWSEQALACLKV